MFQEFGFWWFEGEDEDEDAGRRGQVLRQRYGEKGALSAAPGDSSK